MNLLGAKLYDPAAAATKATSSLLAMTALDTSNLRLTVTVPAHGLLWCRMRCAIEGATTFPQVLLGLLNGASVVARVQPIASLGGTALATTRDTLVAEFAIPGLTPGSITLDAAYGVEIVVAATNIKYGGPNNTTTDDAWGAFVFELWDPQPLPTAAPAAVGGLLTAPTTANVGLADISRINGTAVSVPATAGVLDVNVKNMNNVAATPITTVKAVQGLTTADTITTTTNLTNLPSIPANWLTAAGIAAAALNGKGDWNIGKAGYALSAAGVQAIWDALTSALTTVGSIGKLLVDNINATISSRSQPTDVQSADVKKINGTTVNGNGAGTPWGP